MSKNTLQNAFRHNFTLLSPATLSEFDSENSPPVYVFSGKIFRRDKI